MAYRRVQLPALPIPSLTDKIFFLHKTCIHCFGVVQTDQPGIIDPASFIEVSMAKVTIAITEKEKEEWQHYAAAKGLKSLSTLIRFATVQYLTRYPIKAQGCTAVSESGGFSA